MRLKPLLLTTLIVLICSGLSFAQLGTITTRATTDPMDTGYARWIKLAILNSGGGQNVLNDDFTGTSFLVDLNVDGDDDETTNTPGTRYIIRGDSIETHYTSSGGRGDSLIYLPIRGSYATNLKPRVKLVTAGALRVGVSPFWHSIELDNHFFKCTDGIKPKIRRAYYYDDGSGHSEAAEGDPGNETPYDGYLDRVDIIWSEPMDPSITTIPEGMFTGLGASISGVESESAWYEDVYVPYYDNHTRLTIWLTSISPNTGIEMDLSYNPPSSAADSIRADIPYDETNQRYAAEEQTLRVMDRAGPAIISAHTTRIHDMRRQPLPQALVSKRVWITFSEMVNRSTFAGDDTTLTFYMSGDPGIAQGIQTIHYPDRGNAQSFEVELDSAFVTENDTGTVQFSRADMLDDINGNGNGVSIAAEPPTRVTDPTVRRGPIIPVLDGIYPNIIRVLTRDVALPEEQETGGANGWGYLDYVDVIFDHVMNTDRLSTEGFDITGPGIVNIGSEGEWLDNTTFRIPLAADGQRTPNTGILPQISYNNPMGPQGHLDQVNGGFAADLYQSDRILSENNYRIVEVLDRAGPAIIRSYTAGKRKIRLTLSEKIRVNWPSPSYWPTTEGTAYILPSSRQKFQWYVKTPGTDVGSAPGNGIYFTSLDPSGYDNIFYLHHTAEEWTRNDSGAVNFLHSSVVVDSVGNENDQYDEDLSLNYETMEETLSDVKIQKDDIAPNLVSIETVDINKNGRLDHLRFVFDDTSAVYPKTSFNSEYWQVLSYYLQGYRTILGLNEDLFVIRGSDTLGVYLQIQEAGTAKLNTTDYFGDTGDVPDVVVEAGRGFADWAGNVMAPLPIGLNKEKDKAGPAIVGAKTISTTRVEALVSEDLKNSTVQKEDFNLIMGGGVPILTTVPLLKVTEKAPNEENGTQGRVILQGIDQFYWLPETEGQVSFADYGVVFDDVSDNSTPVAEVDNSNWQTRAIAVNDRIANHFDIALKLPGNPVRGVPFQIEVIALDNSGDVDANFPERINLSSNLSHSELQMPAGSQALDDGIGLFTLKSSIATDSLVISVSVDNDRYAQYFSKSDPIMVEEAVIDAPDTLIVDDYRGQSGEGDQGGFVILTWDYSQNHPGIASNNLIDYYQIYREIDHRVFHWHTVTATDTTGSGADSMRVIIPTGDNFESNFWVRAVIDPNAQPAATAEMSTMLDDGRLLIENVEPQAVVRKTTSIRTLKDKGQATTLASADQVQSVSGAAMGRGRAEDNIAPQAPGYLYAQKEGVAVRLSWGRVTLGVNGEAETFGIKYNVYTHPSDPYFDPETEGQLLATVQDTAYVVAASRAKSYYCVQALDSDNASASSERVAKIGFELTGHKRAQYNYISMPLTLAGVNNAATLTQSIPGIEAVYQLDPNTNRFSRYFLADVQFGDTIPLQAGMPVLISVNESGTGEWFYTGQVPEHMNTQFQLNKSHAVSYNELIVPMDRTDISSADDLAKAIGGGVLAVYKIDAESNSFGTFWIPSTKAGDNFKLEPGDPVLISVTTDAPDIWPQN